ncbi:hypothetical protein GCM10027275_03780 [Rhabdobacter roseus]|uniref:Uncharacterized protein n=1 Tax=Rhabdobacter roseus TaxID=1655419 RepID=A0A840TKD8_9BACT|nr:transposase [Rhabdobacter roseus]MBB5282267.1 hypothetical protein [Rhabdobacter roseus]
MEAISTSYLSRAETWLFITTLTYFLMNGAQLFETAVLVPKWTAAPPESLQLLRGKHGLDLKTFWIVIHSLHEITFILAVIFCWKLAPIRNGLLLLFMVHVAVRVWTLGYFAPMILKFQNTEDLTQIPDLLRQTTLWRTLNYLRVGIFLAVSLGLIPLCLSMMTMKAGR